MPRSLASFRGAAGLSNGAAVFVGVGILTLCWMLLMPPGSGPDEPGHLVRAGAVVRGEFGDDDVFSLSDSYQIAEPGCYAFQPAVPASCALNPSRTGATLDLPSRAGEYPVWGHAVVGVPTLLPVLEPLWWARAAGAAVATLLVGGALAHAMRLHRPATAGLLLGVTPMAWSTFGTVNPSSFAIAGSVALWTGLLVRHDDDTATNNTAVWLDARWLTAIGWATLTLPRRDGLVWACITLTIALVATQRPALSWWRSFSRAQQATIAASTAVTMVWGALSDSRSTQFVVVAPLLIAATEAWRWWWDRPVHTGATRWGTAAAASALGLLATYVVIDTRPGGWDTDLAVDLVMQTDDNIVEAIGVLGWLDTVVPAGAVYLWLIALGMLLAAALMAGSIRPVVWAAVLTGATITTSWVLELVQGNTSGTYWQGRYSIPLIVGIPLLLSIAGRDRAGQTGIPVVHRVVGVSGLIVVNIAAWAAARRFGVGITGSLLPWRWDTAIQPIPPVLLLTVHAAASLWLASTLLRPSAAAPNHG